MVVEIKELTTGFIIPKVNKNFRYYKLENYFSTLNHITKDRDPFGIIETDDAYRIPIISYDLLERLMGDIGYTITKLPHTPEGKFTKPMVMKNSPRDEIQADVIKNVMDHFNNGDNRVIVSLPTGRGKTYVATDIISQLNAPTMVFVKTINLRDQWVQSFFTHSTCKNIAVIESSTDLVNMMENGIRYDIIIGTHRSIQNFINLVGFREFNKFLIEQGIGLKVYDEFDLESSSTFKIETHTSVHRTLYMSATDYKSPACNKIFQSVYGDLPNYGKNYDIVVERNGLFILYNSRPTKKLYGSVHRFTRDGFVFDYQKYHKYIVDNKTWKTSIKWAWDKIIKEKYEDKENYRKTVFFIGRKVTAQQFKKDLSEVTGVPTRSISIVNSDIPEADRKKNEKYKMIISTSNSMGRGVDLKGIDVVVDMETRSSLSNATQVIGRVSRAGSKFVGTYINLVDCAFPTVVRNHEYKMNSGFYNQQLTKIKVLDFTNKRGDD